MTTVPDVLATHRRGCRLSASDPAKVALMSGRIGRPSKGDRVVLYSRPHREVRAAVEASAAKAGYDAVSDYVAAVLANHEGLAELAPVPARHPEQKELPLATSA